MIRKKRSEYLIKNCIMALIISSCANSSKIEKLDFKAFWNNAGELSELSNPIDSRRWSKEKNLIYFNGHIIKGDCKRFESLLEKKNDTLVVNSLGGLVEEGRCIGSLMVKKQFKTTIVRGYCFSSCANYLFLASPQKIIERGVVGFHGNPVAMFKQNQLLKIFFSVEKNKKLTAIDIKKIRGFTKSNQKGMKLTREELTDIEKFRLKSINDIKAEKYFLGNISVPQDIFDITQRADKGEGKNKKYLFLIPSAKTFLKYGITGVNGDSSVKFVEKFNKAKKIGLFYR